jgi:hypothetical protein
VRHTMFSAQLGLIAAACEFGREAEGPTVADVAITADGRIVCDGPDPRQDRAPPRVIGTHQTLDMSLGQAEELRQEIERLSWPAGERHMNRAQRRAAKRKRGKGRK